MSGAAGRPASSLSDAEVIARQAKRIMELELQQSALEQAIKKALSHIYCIGGPLNDNQLGFTSKQMLVFQRIADHLEER